MTEDDARARREIEWLAGDNSIWGVDRRKKKRRVIDNLKKKRMVFGGGGRRRRLMGVIHESESRAQKRGSQQSEKIKERTQRDSEVGCDNFIVR